MNQGELAFTAIVFALISVLHDEKSNGWARYGFAALAMACVGKLIFYSVAG